MENEAILSDEFKAMLDNNPDLAKNIGSILDIKAIQEYCDDAINGHNESGCNCSQIIEFITKGRE